MIPTSQMRAPRMFGTACSSGNKRRIARHARSLTAIFTGVVALCAANATLAGDLEDGAAAWSRHDYPAAFKLLSPIAERGDAVAENYLGEMYYEGKGVPQDYGQAVKWETLSAQQGNASAQASLGDLYYYGQGASQNYADALKWFALSAQQGLPVAEDSVANMHLEGKGVPQDYVEALRWYNLSAEQGDAIAENYLGFMYHEGKGVPQDYAQALKWETLSAQQDDAWAQAQLGTLYYRGEGVSQNYTEALKWYTASAQQGNPTAQRSLGTMYAHGDGVPQDYEQALKWFRVAAGQGDAVAQNEFGVMYFSGYGVPRNYVRAYMWFDLAASGPSGEDRKTAESNRDNAAAQLTQDAIVVAQALAAKCQASNYRSCGDARGSSWPSLPRHPKTAVRAVPRATATLSVGPKVDPRPTLGGPNPSGAVAETRVPMNDDGGTFLVPVLVNNAITLDFTIDSGASDVCVPEDVVLTLIRAGTVTKSDFEGTNTYVMADGTKVASRTFVIRSLKIGGRVIQNVKGSVVSPQGDLLLGQSFLKRFKSWSIDNASHMLVLQ